MDKTTKGTEFRNKTPNHSTINANPFHRNPAWLVICINCDAMKYTLFQSIVAIYDGDHAVSTIPAGETIEIAAPVRELGIVKGWHDGRRTRVMAIDLRRFGKRRRLGES
jgi:hypothetical protein